MLLKSHYIKYNKNITFAIFNLIVDKVIADGYHLPNAVNTEYKFFKTDHPFFTWNEYKNSTIIGAYNERFIKENNSNNDEANLGSQDDIQALKDENEELKAQLAQIKATAE